MPNEAVTVAPDQTAGNDEQSKEQTYKLADLSGLENVVKEYAKVVAARHGIRHDHFELHLTSKMGGVMKVTGGHTVKIFLLWPDAQPQINTLLNDAFTLMKKYPVRRTMEIVPVAYVRTMSQEIKKKWKKEKFVDDSDIVLDLIPRHRIRIKQTVTTEVSDVVTGEKLTLVHEYPTTRFDTDATGLWLELSRRVRDHHPEENEDLPDDEPKSDTPILDETLASPEYVVFEGPPSHEAIE